MPKSDAKRRKLIEQFQGLESTIVIYESPHRLSKLLELVLDVYGNIKVFLAKDISKMREESFSGTVSEVLEVLKERDIENNPHGEFVCVFSEKN